MALDNGCGGPKFRPLVGHSPAPRVWILHAPRPGCHPIGVRSYSLHLFLFFFFAGPTGALFFFVLFCIFPSLTIMKGILEGAVN